MTCLLAAACSQPTSNDGNAERVPCPGCNVVLISMDTVRSDHVGAYGYELPTTPNLDRLATRSAVFEHAVSQAAWTLPAHGSIMTGLYPGRLGVVRYPAVRRLPDSTQTLAGVFSSAGYRTAGFTGGGFVSAHFGFDRGFQVYTTDGRRFEHNLDNAISWLELNRHRPFFLFFHGYNAHRPYYSEAMDKLAVGLPEKIKRDRGGYCGRNTRDRPEDLETIIAFYDASVHAADRRVGELLRALETLGLMDKTVLLVTSDHGEEFFEHGNCDHVRFLYGEVINVPYVVYVPGFNPSGKRIRDTVPASISVARTLLDLVGVANTMPGVSLLPMIDGSATGFDGPVYSEADSVAGRMGSRGPVVSIIKEREKLIAFTGEGSEEAYDLEVDPGEQHILPESHAAYRRRWTLRAWAKALTPLPKPGRSVVKAVSRKAREFSDRQPSGKEEELPIPEELENSLKSLGYLE